VRIYGHFCSRLQNNVCLENEFFNRIGQSLPFVAFSSGQTESTGACVEPALSPEEAFNINWRYLGKS
jgi:hypothetical protein